MEIYKLQQLSVTVCFIIASVLCCVCFDVLRAIRNTYPLKGATAAIMDILFWIVCSIIIYVCLYFSNNADIRWYEFAGSIIGIILYIAFIGKHIYKIILKIIKLCFKILSFIFKISGIPCKILHILIMPFKNFIIKLKAIIYYVFHVNLQKIINKTKKLYLSIKKNWNTNLTIIHLQLINAII